MHCHAETVERPQNAAMRRAAALAAMLALHALALTAAVAGKRPAGAATPATPPTASALCGHPCRLTPPTLPPPRPSPRCQIVDCQTVRLRLPPPVRHAFLNPCIGWPLHRNTFLNLIFLNHGFPNLRVSEPEFPPIPPFPTILFPNFRHSRHFRNSHFRITLTAM